MEKQDLKTGMLVLQRNGSIQLLVNKTFIVKTGGFNKLSSVNDDLSNKIDGESDIVKVSTVLKGWYLGTDQWSEKLINKNLLWQENEIFACELDGVTYSQSTLRSIIKKAHTS